MSLPLYWYHKFVNLISVVTEGAAFCPTESGSYCLLPSSCSNYQNLWEYRIRSAFTGQGELNDTVTIWNVEIPLATYARTKDDSCEVHIEYKSKDFYGTKLENTVIFGAMTY